MHGFPEKAITAAKRGDNNRGGKETIKVLLRLKAESRKKSFQPGREKLGYSDLEKGGKKKIDKKGEEGVGEKKEAPPLPIYAQKNSSSSEKEVLGGPG